MSPPYNTPDKMQRSLHKSKNKVKKKKKKQKCREMMNNSKEPNKHEVRMLKEYNKTPSRAERTTHFAITTVASYRASQFRP